MKKMRKSIKAMKAMKAMRVMRAMKKTMKAMKAMKTVSATCCNCEQAMAPWNTKLEQTVRSHLLILILILKGGVPVHPHPKGGD